MSENTSTVMLGNRLYCDMFEQSARRRGREPVVARASARVATIAAIASRMVPPGGDRGRRPRVALSRSWPTRSPMISTNASHTC